MTIAFKHKLKQDFNKASKNYQNFANLQKEVNHKLFLLAQDEIHKGNNIIDIGCGTGFLKKEIDDSRILEKSLVQVDIASEMLDVIEVDHGRYKSHYLVNADYDSMPFRDSSYDICYSSLALQWSQDLKNSLAEIVRVCREGGYVFISTLLDGSLKELRSINNELGNIISINNFDNKKEYLSILEDLGVAIQNYKVLDIKKNYNNVRELLHSMKSIGAGNKTSASKIMSKKSLLNLEQVYRDRFSDGENVFATWEVLLIKIKK